MQEPSTELLWICFRVVTFTMTQHIARSRVDAWYIRSEAVTTAIEGHVIGIEIDQMSVIATVRVMTIVTRILVMSVMASKSVVITGHIGGIRMAQETDFTSVVGNIGAIIVCDVIRCASQNVEKRRTVRPITASGRRGISMAIGAQNATSGRAWNNASAR